MRFGFPVTTLLAALALASPAQAKLVEQQFDLPVRATNA